MNESYSFCLKSEDIPIIMNTTALHEDNGRLIELISSKICHDLISPVGAISNGVEILGEIGADDEVTSLIAFSASQANAKLKTLRLAYGIGGADELIKIDEIHTTFGEFIGGEKRVTQDWNAHIELGFEKRRGFPKLMMCCLLLAVESLPKGGVITVDTDAAAETLIINATGENAKLRDGYQDALSHEIAVDALEPKFIHPYITQLFAQKYGFELSTEQTAPDVISLRLKQPSVS